MKKLISIICLALSACIVYAEDIEVNEVNYAGPFNVKQPVMLDSLDMASKTFEPKAFLDSYMDLSLVRDAKAITVASLPATSTNTAVHLLGFNISNTSYTKVSILIKGIKYSNIYVDGKKTDGKSVELQPAMHEVVVKYLTNNEELNQTIEINVKADQETSVCVVNSNQQRLYQLTDVLHCWRFNKVDISPDGKYVIVGYSTVQKDGKNVTKTVIKNLATGAVIDQKTAAFWMPITNKYCFIRTVDDVRTLVAADPLTHEETVIAENFPEGTFQMSPTEDYMIFNRLQRGPKEDADVYQVYEPDDRQPGWRNRNTLDFYDMKTAMLTPLTFGAHNFHLMDISADGKYVLVSKTIERLQQRPTSLTSIYAINIDTYQVDTLVCNDGFCAGALFSPDGRQVLLTGSPEAFGGIGNVVPEGKTPSMIDIQMYIMDLNTKKIRPMTRSFNPNVMNVLWSKADGMVYFNAEDKDCVHLFQMNPNNGKIKLVNVPEDMVNRFSCASAAPVMALYGQGASNSDRLYALNTKSLKTTLIEDLNKETLKNIKLGECKPWNYINEKGDTICCRFYLPPTFSPSQQYPMIVNYYGGCSPTSRNFESRYPSHAYAAQGYVVLIVNPSGATGFGQEFSSRHVNTAGEGVAEDIIGATKQFCKEHAYVDDKHIGCIGASYGGFMTQYLQTKTDIFAAAISHAGISDHTSYWGEGYWGYSYSEVSMANSYPWTDKHLYVEQSPLFNADKINTPILFLHGDKDTNVPVGESIQMFNALKLLGKETAMVLVKDQDHHIIDYNKRIKWQNTIFAWFAKYLKNDPSWWNAIYKQPNM